MIQELLDIKHVFLIGISGQLIVGMLRQIVFIREERPDAAQLQDAFPAIEHRQFIHGQEIFATMSSGKFKKGQALSKKVVFHSACPFLIHVFCLALFEIQNYNILDGGAKWII